MKTKCVTHTYFYGELRVVPCYDVTELKMFIRRNEKIITHQVGMRTVLLKPFFYLQTFAHFSTLLKEITSVIPQKQRLLTTNMNGNRRPITSPPTARKGRLKMQNRYSHCIRMSTDVFIISRNTLDN
jgi:hypothetical protein